MKIEPHLESMLPQLELRVLHGLQSGSRLTLFIGDYVLGTDDECEVMLAGPRLRGVHARLQFDGDRAAITPLDGKVLDAQGNEIGENFPLALGMPVDLGGVWICVDEIDTPWPATDELIPHPAPQPTTVREESVRSTPTAATALPAIPKQDSNRKHARRVLVFAMSTLATIALLGIVGAGWLATRSVETPTPAPPRNEDGKQLDALMARLAETFPGRSISVKPGAGGVTVVTAYAADKTMADRMETSIRKYAGTPIVQLFRDDSMLDSAREVTRKFRQDGTRAMAQVTEVSNGVAVVKGTIVSNSTRDELLEALRNGVAGLRSIDASLRNAEELPSVLSDRIANAGLSKKLQVVSQQPEFILRGALSEEDMQRWESLLLDFSNEFGRLLSIRATIALLQQRPPVDIKTIVGGPMPFIITESGQRISIGGETNGHTVSAIRDNEVIFDGNQRYRIPR